MNSNITKSNIKGVVYKVTNNLDGKVYIGRTIRLLRYRMSEHTRGKGLLSNAIRKHGEENFSVEVLYESKELVELNKQERILIKEYNTVTPKGYNIVEGGDGTMGYNHTPESRMKMSENRVRQYREDNHFYGKTHSDETKEKISAIHKGKTISDGHIKSMVAKNKKKIINLDTLVIYNSVLEAADSVNRPPTNITRVCKGRRKSAGGYRWAHYQEGMCLDNQQMSLF